MEQPQPRVPPISSGGLEEVRHRARVRQLEGEQNLPMGIAAGAIAAAAGATVWALLTVATSYQIGWMAVGVGFLVGYAVRLLGKGLTPLYGVIGSGLALLGCLAGNVLTICIVISRQESIPLGDLLVQLNPQVVIQLLADTFQPMDVLFYGLATYAAYHYSFSRPAPDTPEPGPAPS